MADAGKLMNPQHLGWDLADIRINLANQIGIPDHFWLKFWHWQRFALSEHGLVICVVVSVVIACALVTDFFCNLCLFVIIITSVIAHAA